MKYLGQGVFESADGHRFEYEREAPPTCSACGHEPADAQDGLCGFCREDGAVGRVRPVPKLTPEQEAQLRRAALERRADIERRYAR